MPINNFFDPESTYGWTGEWYPSTVLGQRDLNLFNREGAWTAFLAEQGLFSPNLKGAFARSLYNLAQQGYAGALTRNPTLGWQEYLNTLNLPAIVASLTPAARGEAPQRYIGPLRLLMRQQ